MLSTTLHYPLVFTALHPSLYSTPVCTEPGLQQRVRGRLCPHAAQLTPALCASWSPSPTWGTFGSYVICALINPTEKKGRIPSHPPSFVCALLHHFKSFLGVQFGETPCYTFSALRKAGISLTRPWNFAISGSFWCVFQSSAHPPLIDLKAGHWNQELEKDPVSTQAYMSLSFYKHRIQSRLHQHKPVQTIHLRTEYLISLKAGTAISQL